MVDITILELHLPEAQFNAPFAGSTPEDSVDSAAADDADDGEGGGSPTQAVVVLLVLVGLALLARRLRGSRTPEEA